MPGDMIYDIYEVRERERERMELVAMQMMRKVQAHQ